MYNQVILIGRISKLPNQENTELTLSVPRNFKNADGVYENDIIKCSLGTEIGKRTLEYCLAGDLVAIKGRVQSDGKSMIIVTEKISFLSQKQNG